MMATGERARDSDRWGRDATSNLILAGRSEHCVGVQERGALVYPTVLVKYGGTNGKERGT